MTNSKNILIVDDNLDIREMLEKFLGGCGFNTLTAKDAEEAFSFLRKNFFDLAITNYEMSGITGEELIRFIKENYPYLKVWGMSSADKREDFYKAGADFFIEKPFNITKLKALLKTI